MQNKQNNTNTKSQSSYTKMEEDVLDFWEKADTFKKSIKKDSPKGNYVFNDGPPFITGLPHYATLLPSIAKDIIPRYFTMKGYRVERVWGWDCHGLPAENKVEEQLELKNKKDIEELGVDKFVNACRSYVDKGSEQWEWYINRIGRWVDMKNAYKTMDLNFMESVIWSFKQLYDSGFIYEGYRTSLHCPRCATPLSKFEITMDDGSYREVTDKSIVVKFKTKNANKKQKDAGIDNNTYILVWTTTPWTLPGNLALAVGADIEYLVVEVKETFKPDENNKGLNLIPGKYIVAAERYEHLAKENKYFSDNIQRIKGTDLVGLEYETLYPLEDKTIATSDKTYKIYVADFVTTEDGTGVVHIAPNFGEDDFELGKKIGIPMIDLMDDSGTYLEPAGKWNGFYYKKANRDVLIDLDEKNIIVSSLDITHSYPFCYRCSTPLIYKTQKAWYLDIQKIKQRMLETNKEINWVPGHFKDGRFSKNIENAPDWCLSRSRYWGSPLPVWKCDSCTEIKVLGSIEEIEKASSKKVKDLHRPDIDEHTFQCRCGGTMNRVKEVFDCWFESGAMPFAQFHYPFERQSEFKKLFPADFIIEYTGQLRGWFYYLHVLSNALFDSVSFKNVVVSGVLAGTDGRKMSKSFGNYPDPRTTLEKYGSDALRMYFMNSPIMLGDDTSLSEIDIQDALRKNVIVLWNVVKFYELFMSDGDKTIEEALAGKKNVLDIWILTRLNQLHAEVTENLDKYNLPVASRPISGFINDLSTWYLRRSRDRFKGDDESDKQAAIATTKYVLINLSKIMAPFTPFISEQIWQKMTGNNFADNNKSVHLESWVETNELIKIDKVNILDNMHIAMNIVELGLSKRDEAGIKVRQPLQEVKVMNCNLQGEFKSLVLDELNVKKITCTNGTGDLTVELDTNITSELKLECIKRDLVRLVNAARKNTGLSLNDRAEIVYNTDGASIIEAITTFRDEILKDTLSSNIRIADNTEDLKDVKIEGVPIKLGLKMN
jgi:isoleucyl-tRNA synthetase